MKERLNYMKTTLTMIALGMCLINVGCTDDTKTLHVYCWSDYISPEVLEQFESRYNCHVVIDSFDSNESMYAKLKAGCTGYDVIMPTSYQVPQLAAECIIDKLDPSLLKNVHSNFYHKFDNQILDSKLTYSVPYAVTYTGLMYAKNKIPAGIEVNTWKVFEDKRLNAKLTMLDDMREVIGIGLMTLGYSLNSTNSVEIDKATEYILSIRDNVRKFDTESYKTEVSNGSVWIGHGYSSDSFQVIFGEDDETSRRDDIGFALPREGFTIAWDELCIMTSAPEKDLAYKFIDYMYELDTSVANMIYTCSPMANKLVYELKLEDDNIKNIIDNVMPNDDIVKNGQVLKSFHDMPNVQEMYNKAWDKIRALKK